MDHFHPPLYGVRHWESFHALWAAGLVAGLNRGVLPEGYFAEAQVHIGGRMEVDVASFERDSFTPASERNGGVAVETVTAPVATATLPMIFPDDIEIQVYSSDAGPTLVGAVELVSPANKDRTDTRIAFAAKCAALLQRGIGVVVINIVTNRHANLHDDLIELLKKADELRFPGGPELYAVSYHPYRSKSGAEQADVRFYELALQKDLPTVPLSLRRGPTVPLGLESAYKEACERSRL